MNQDDNIYEADPYMVDDVEDEPDTAQMQVQKEPSLKDTLMTALGVDESELQKLLQEAFPTTYRKKPPRKATFLTGPIREYVSVKKTCICVTCGATTIHTYKLRERESIAWIDKTGKVRQYTVVDTDTDFECTAYFSKCHECRFFLRAMPREELEERFFELLDKLPINLISFSSTGGKK